ncbi:hypothetical protein OXYTRIMIC_706 [Oxytricha trifallax]|uniref:Uncharacterized protein n=1 Tax=Oxytricha trifallax TaxID=1172189 RepID=A0A073HZ33_9SPIT|nr:hypothetical protein OXYTRIMIC_706 [Oxytricha trifallax]
MRKKSFKDDLAHDRLGQNLNISGFSQFQKIGYPHFQGIPLNQNHMNFGIPNMMQTTVVFPMTNDYFQQYQQMSPLNSQLAQGFMGNITQNPFNTYFQLQMGSQMNNAQSMSASKGQIEEVQVKSEGEEFEKERKLQKLAQQQQQQFSSKVKSHKIDLNKKSTQKIENFVDPKQSQKSQMSGYSNQLKSNASLMLNKHIKQEVEKVIGAEYSIHKFNFKKSSSHIRVTLKVNFSVNKFSKQIELPQALMGLYRDLTSEEELFKCIQEQDRKVLQTFKMKCVQDKMALQKIVAEYEMQFGRVQMVELEKQDQEKNFVLAKNYITHISDTIAQIMKQQQK